MLKSAVGAKQWYNLVKVDFGVITISGGLDVKAALMSGSKMKKRRSNPPIFFDIYFQAR